MNGTLEIDTIKVGSPKTYYELIKKRKNLEIININRSSETTLSFYDKKDGDIFLMGIIMSGEAELSYNNVKRILHKNDYFHYETLEDFVNIFIPENANILVITSMNFYEDIHNGFKKFYDIMNCIEQKDSYTKRHCERVTQLAKRIGEKMGFSNKRNFNLVYGARFHDLGKIRVSDEILNKKERLNEDEFVNMRRHVEYSYEIFLNDFKHFESDFDFELMAKMILQHHERLNGSGYPKGLSGDEILLEAKIIAVCDSFDAMVTDRPYKKGKSKEDAVKELKAMSGTHYDSNVVTFLEKVLEEKYSELYENK